MYAAQLRSLVRVQRLSAARGFRWLSEASASLPNEGPKKRSMRDLPPPISLTARAAERIKELLGTQPDALGIRLGVRRRGCNGLSYTMNYALEEKKGDEEVREHGVRVFVDPMAVFHIVGTEMDWEETELSAEFTFKNPNSKGECGCGESFNT